MTKKKKGSREEAYFLILFFFILGIGLLICGYLIGIIAVGLALLITIAMFPTVGEVISSITKGIISILRKQKLQKALSTPVEEKAIEEESQKVREIIQKIEEFRFPKTPKSEVDCEIMLVSYLQAFFPEIKRQEQYPDMRIDAVINKIGIEIKFRPSLNDFHMLYSQIEDRLQYLEKIVVVSFSETDKQVTSKFLDKLKTRDWLNKKVFVISK
jgi:hypothetical protein